MQAARILITGATGYIGGTVLTKLKSSPDAKVQNSQIDVLIRGEERVPLFESLGVRVVTFQNLDETDFIRKLSSNYDESTTGQKAHFIHTSGTSSIGDHPVSKTYIETRELVDTDNVYEYQKARESKEGYKQRTTDLAVFSTGIELDVKTTIVMAPTIFGLGTGPVNQLSIQIPALLKQSMKYDQAVVIGDGAGEWDHVHIADLADLFEIILVKVLNGDEDVPYGADGLLFAETGRHTWMEISQGIASAGQELGSLGIDGVRSVSLEEATSWSANGNQQVRELGFASNARSKAVHGRALGWTPHREAEWKVACKTDFEAVLNQAD